MILTPQIIEAGALAMANFDAMQVDCPTLKSIDEFRFDNERTEYLKGLRLFLMLPSPHGTPAKERRRELPERLQKLQTSRTKIS